MANCPEEKGAATIVGLLSTSKANHAFAKKVFSIVAAQILVTIVLMTPFVLIDELKNFASEYYWIYSVLLFAFLLIFVGLSLFKCLRQKHPWNFVALDFFTVVVALSTGFSIAKLERLSVVFIALVVVVCLCALIIFLAFLLGLNYTSSLAITVTFVWSLIFVLISLSFWFDNALVNCVVISGFIFGYSIYILIVIQTAFYGKTEYYDNGSDYILAVVRIYASFVLIWEHVLKLCDNSVLKLQNN